ncbi:hypothetical protein [Amycolatopsis cihanbeyliensis]|uniref:Uncharacterized protein n=1 Tax=Amycolatopsis cihanbeyliensis TaxID=1128664 RepID=A0A542DMC7_AMYCI|nr:hypothetical protein [Amycolatopsis cihanbeyliensis]TQJ04251.1 hypothetical protein FB471_4034 [Amycolatopsis cihanbeyliensis]
MNGKRTWVVAGATLAIAGFGTTVALAADGSGETAPRDQRDTPVVQQVQPQPGPAAATDAADTADSADSAASPADPADTADSPDGPDSANSPG